MVSFDKWNLLQAYLPAVLRTHKQSTQDWLWKALELLLYLCSQSRPRSCKAAAKLHLLDVVRRHFGILQFEGPGSWSLQELVSTILASATHKQGLYCSKEALLSTNVTTFWSNGPGMKLLVCSCCFWERMPPLLRLSAYAYVPLLMAVFRVPMLSRLSAATLVLNATPNNYTKAIPQDGKHMWTALPQELLQSSG